MQNPKRGGGMKSIFVLAAISILLFAGCAGTQKPAPIPAPAANNTSAPSAGGTGQIANPASVNCVQKGYKLEIRTAADGSQTGYCIFGNGNECEEWAFFRGECNETHSIIHKEGQMCGGIAGIMCADGLSCKIEGNYPDAGGTCVNASSESNPAAFPVFTSCPAKRGDVCPTIYSPVCGKSGTTPSTTGYSTYSNSCVACSKSSPAASYAQGTCESLNLTQKAKDKGVLYYCPPARTDGCTNESDPVCGRLVDPSSSLSNYRDYQNPCTACSNSSNAIAYYVGTCAEK